MFDPSVSLVDKDVDHDRRTGRDRGARRTILGASY
jgi:hypothetical protein